MKNIALLGCGWLGLPLAKKLIANNYQVLGTTTSTEKLDYLNSLGIYAHLFRLGETRDLDFLNSAETLFFNIPPGLRAQTSGSFIQKFGVFLNDLKKHTNITKLVYANSTTVYPSEGLFDETSLFVPDTEKGKELLASEHLLLDTFPQSSIIRFGGLFGPDRNPINFIRSAKQFEQNTSVNLIHLDDVLNISFATITQVSPTIINAVHPHHPDKYSFYKKVFESVNQPFPYTNPNMNVQREITMGVQLNGFEFEKSELWSY